MPVESSPQPRWNIDTWLFGVFVVAFALLAVLFALKPLGDYDFWWHLKTGELMVKSRSLLAADPFNFTGDPTMVSTQERLVLNAYWLWQVVAYGFYWLGGFLGVKLLNLLTLVATYAAIGHSLVRNRIRVTLAIPLLCVSLFAYQALYSLERPQIVSFLFAAVLVSFFITIRHGGRPSCWLYPMMLVWGNIHGGVIVGTLLLALFGIGSAWDMRHDRQRLIVVALWCLGGGLASLLNPNGFGNYSWAMGMVNQGTSANIAEFRSTFWVYTYTNKNVVLVWGLALTLLAALWWSRERRGVSDWLISLCVLVLSVMYVRNAAFLAVSLLPMIAWCLKDGLDAIKSDIRHVERLISLGVVLVFIGFSCFLLAPGLDETRRKNFWGDIAANKVPQDLGDFLAQAPLEGNIFNEYNWGGYLLWRLYPKFKLFIDGRGIDSQVFSDSLKIKDASLEEKNGSPEYLQLLEKYQIDYVAMPYVKEFGLIQTLMKYLLVDKNWHPIFFGSSGFVLAKAGTKTAKVIDKYRIDRMVFLNQLLTSFNRLIQDNPGRASFYLSRGELLGYLGRYDEAARDFESVRQLDADYPVLDSKFSQLRKLREKASSAQGKPATP